MDGRMCIYTCVCLCVCVRARMVMVKIIPPLRLVSLVSWFV